MNLRWTWPILNGQADRFSWTTCSFSLAEYKCGERAEERRGSNPEAESTACIISHDAKCPAGARGTAGIILGRAVAITR